MFDGLSYVIEIVCISIDVMQGAGHTVPEYKPKEALAFFSRWLDGKEI